MLGLTPDHVVGVPEVDQQNDKLNKILNQLIQFETPVGIISAASSLLTEKFRLEESLITRYSGVPYEYHFKQHGVFRKILHVLLQRASNRDKEVLQAFKDVLIPKVSRHILIDDFVIFAHIPELRRQNETSYKHI